jgi:hypothetical protein
MSDMQPADVGIRIAAGKDTTIVLLMNAAREAAKYMVMKRYGLKAYIICGDEFKAIEGELFSGRGEIELCVGRIRENEHAHLIGNYQTDTKYNIVDVAIYLVRA